MRFVTDDLTAAAVDAVAHFLARLGRPVKIMIGGITGWQDEGFAFASGD